MAHAQFVDKFGRSLSTEDRHSILTGSIGRLDWGVLRRAHWHSDIKAEGGMVFLADLEYPAHDNRLAELTPVGNPRPAEPAWTLMIWDNQREVVVTHIAAGRATDVYRHATESWIEHLRVLVEGDDSKSKVAARGIVHRGLAEMFQQVRVDKDHTMKVTAGAMSATELLPVSTLSFSVLDAPRTDRALVRVSTTLCFGVEGASGLHASAGSLKCPAGTRIELGERTDGLCNVELAKTLGADGLRIKDIESEVAAFCTPSSAERTDELIYRIQQAHGGKREDQRHSPGTVVRWVSIS